MAWGENLSPGFDRFCPDCGVVLEAGHARCRRCFLLVESAHRNATERAWMSRNWPDFRPQYLFPEDYE